MKNLMNFKNVELNQEESVNIKGGVFCEWYLGQRSENGNTSNAMKLMEKVDPVMAANGNENFA